jgi:hypothetical protein
VVKAVVDKVVVELLEILDQEVYLERPTLVVEAVVLDLIMMQLYSMVVMVVPVLSSLHIPPK